MSIFRRFFDIGPGGGVWEALERRKTGGKKNRALAGFLRYYNEERPHSALGLRTPAEMAKLARASAGTESPAC